MKTSWLPGLIIGWLVYSPISNGQATKLAFYPRQYVVKLQLASQAKAGKGILYELTDSTLVLAPMEWKKSRMKTTIKQHGGTLPPTDSLRQVFPLRTYRYADISRLTVHRRGSAAKGFLIGAGIGAIGSTAGLLLFPDGFDINFSGPRSRITPSQKAAGVISALAAVGAPGLLIGVVTTRHIDAKRHTVSIEVKKRFRDYTIVEQVNRAVLYTRYR